MILIIFIFENGLEAISMSRSNLFRTLKKREISYSLVDTFESLNKFVKIEWKFESLQSLNINLSSINSIIFINAIHILINISSSWFFY